MTLHKPADERRQQILGAAMRCFVSRGYVSTRVEDIAAEADLSKGGIYFHFPSKRDIFLALVNEHLRGIVRQVVGPDNEPISMPVCAERYFQFLDANPDAARFFLVMNEEAVRDADLRALLVKIHHEPVVRAIARSLMGEPITAELLQPSQTFLDAPEALRNQMLTYALVIKAAVDGIQGAIGLGMEYDAESVIDTIRPVIRQIQALNQTT